MNDTAATTETSAEEGWDWALVEIMGHRTHWGRIREVERYGTKMIRVDVPKITETLEVEVGEPVQQVAWSTHFYGGAAIFSLTLTDEATVMKRNAPYTPPYRLTQRPEIKEVASVEAPAVATEDDSDFETDERGDGTMDDSPADDDFAF